MADFAEEKEERGKVVDDLGQNPLMEKKLVSGVSQCFPSMCQIWGVEMCRDEVNYDLMIIIMLTCSG